MIINYKDLKASSLKKSIKNGKIIIFPSDGTYLIGCNFLNKEARETIKGLGFNFVIPRSKKWIETNFKTKKNYLNRIPGPFIYVFDVKNKKILEKNLGISIPTHEITKKMQGSGNIIFNSDLNTRNLRDISKEIRKKADIIIDNGILEGDKLTIIDLREKIAKIVR
nr:hypothetical protein [Candidatus Woesearchaeota archaeon]